jgi:hypothetical protein
VFSVRSGPAKPAFALLGLSPRTPAAGLLSQRLIPDFAQKVRAQEGLGAPQGLGPAAQADGGGALEDRSGLQRRALGESAFHLRDERAAFAGQLQGSREGEGPAQEGGPGAADERPAALGPVGAEPAAKPSKARAAQAQRGDPSRRAATSHPARARRSASPGARRTYRNREPSQQRPQERQRSESDAMAQILDRLSTTRPSSLEGEISGLA